MRDERGGWLRRERVVLRQCWPLWFGTGEERRGAGRAIGGAVIRIGDGMVWLGIGGVAVAMMVAAVRIGANLVGVRGVNGCGNVNQKMGEGNMVLVSLDFCNIVSIPAHQTLDQA